MKLPLQAFIALQVIYGPTWTDMDLYGPIWTHMDLYGPTWTYMDLCGTIWTYTDPIWTYRRAKAGCWERGPDYNTKSLGLPPPGAAAQGPIGLDVCP